MKYLLIILILSSCTQAHEYKKPYQTQHQIDSSDLVFTKTLIDSMQAFINRGNQGNPEGIKVLKLHCDTLEGKLVKNK